MLCDKCKKNPASVHVTQVINGEETTYNLCAPCAVLLGFESDMDDSDFGFGNIGEDIELDGLDFKNFNFENFMKGFINSVMGMGAGQSAPAQPFASTIKCPRCSMTYDEFKAGGKFGCSECFTSFKNPLPSLFKGIHGSASHEGKLPRRAGASLSRQREIDKLKARLRAFVEAEQYEEAAALRDHIKALAAESTGADTSSKEGGL